MNPEDARASSPAGRFFVLGCALSALAVMYPLLGYGLPGLAAWTASFWLVVLGVLRASTSHGPARRAERVLALLAGIGSLGTVALHGVQPEPHDVLFTLFDALALAFLVVATFRTLKSVLFGDHSKHDHLLSAACAYVLIGITFAYVLVVIEGATGVPQVHVAPENQVPGDDPIGLTRARFLFLSFVTLTTLGYGDITAVTLESRMVLGVESVIGQLYLAIMVARLIGLHTSGASERT